MANEEQLGILRQGVEAWNEWRGTNKDAKIDLRFADLSGVNLTSIDLHIANLRGAKIRESCLDFSILHGAELKKADMTGSWLREADIRIANMASSIMENVNMQGAFLVKSDLTDAYLVNANMSETVLIRANLRGAHMNRTILRNADLRFADLTECYLGYSNLEGAFLSDTQLNNADMTHIRLGESKMVRTVFANNDLRTAQGLERIRHLGPSTLGVDTLLRSGGKIPETFLRGCGVPESVIEYLPSLIGAMQPIQFYSCFVSHSTKDHDFAQRLFDRLQGQRIRVWFAPEELKGGRLLDDQIDHAIRLHDKLILVLSDESVRSKWVMKEIRKARREELANNRRKLFPIRLTDMQTLEHWECLDPETGHDLADVVRSYFIPDFSNWKDHDAFERAFTKFLNALKAVDEPPADGQDNEKRLQYLQRNLNLKQQVKAKFGIHVPTYIELEIEDLKQEIARLEGDSTE